MDDSAVHGDVVGIKISDYMVMTMARQSEYNFMDLR
jgi:hypothetical protein